jgi:hypothetical protein
MAIYLKRNNQPDINHPVTSDIFKTGYIYKLVKVIEYEDYPDTVILKVRSEFSMEFRDIPADSNCFDVARELDR